MNSSGYFKMKTALKEYVDWYDMNHAVEEIQDKASDNLILMSEKNAL